MTNIKYPEMRRDLLYYLKLICDLNSNRSSVRSATEDLEYITHFFFDDTELATNADDYLGWVLKNKSETDAIRNLGQSLDVYIERVAPNDMPLVLTQGELWEAVRENARKALSVLSQ